MDEPAHIIQVTGATQCGKSTLVGKLIMGRRRVIIASPFPVDPRKYRAEQFSSVREAVEAFKVFKGSTFRVAITVRSPREFAALCQLAWVMAPCLLVLDETTLYLPSPAETPMEFKLICQAWAHAGDAHGDERKVEVMAIGQRPINLPPIFRAEVQVWYVFRLNSSRDRQLLKDDFGLNFDEAEATGKLAPYAYVRVDRFGNLSHGKTSV